MRQFLEEAAKQVSDHLFTSHFLLTEWDQVVDAWQLESWDAYREVRRLGRKTRLPERQRVVLWSIFELLRSKLKAGNLITYSNMFNRLTSQFIESKRSPFEYVVVDEAQDISVAQLGFLAAFGADDPNSLFFAGDLGQRIFQQPFSWKALGADIRGRSATLRINYRTSHQIRMQADRLLGPELSDVDGNMEDRRRTVSVFNGQSPSIIISDRQEREIETDFLSHLGLYEGFVKLFPQVAEAGFNLTGLISESLTRHHNRL